MIHLSKTLVEILSNASSVALHRGNITKRVGKSYSSLVTNPSTNRFRQDIVNITPLQLLSRQVGARGQAPPT